jgi:hypothetical protein
VQVLNFDTGINFGADGNPKELSSARRYQRIFLADWAPSDAICRSIARTLCLTAGRRTHTRRRRPVRIVQISRRSGCGVYKRCRHVDISAPSV